MIDDIGIATCSCGACPGNKLCDKCRDSTMRANGLPVEWADELIGLTTGWSYSEIYWKLVELIKKRDVEFKNEKL